MCSVNYGHPLLTFNLCGWRYGLEMNLNPISKKGMGIFSFLSAKVRICLV